MVLTGPVASTVRAQNSAAAVPAALNPPAALTPEVCEIAVSRFVFEYEGERHPGLPEMDVLLTLAQVTLTRNNEGFVRARFGPEELATGTVSIADLNAQLVDQDAPKFSRAALRDVLNAVVRYLNEQGVIGIIVEADQQDLVVERLGEGQEQWTDLRAEEGRTELRLKLYAATVAQIRTVAAGERVRDDRRIDNPVHSRIKAGSPVGPEPTSEGERRDLIRRDQLDDYVLRLNRQAGRRVDVAISAGTEPNTVVLDYVVRENSPLLLYAQVSNTGTEQTELLRERVGFVLNQVTDSDDQLAVDYVTASFEKTNIVNASYTLPLGDTNILSLKTFGTYSEFDASEVGQAGESFTGSGYLVGGELAYTVLQVRDLFIDLYGGAKYQHVEVNNASVQITGEADFFLPSFGARLEKRSEEAVSVGDIGLEFNLPGLAGTESEELPRLGRLATSDDWVVFKFNLEQSFYLEPLLDRDNWLAGLSTLAHELAFSLRGQSAFGYRLVPTFEQTAGGLYSVRGYDESVSAGDTVVIGTAEYRLHVPRLFAVEPNPRTLLGEPFRFAPQQPYGRPDWDLILRTFIDAAKTQNNDRLSFENDNTLVGTGVGFELLYRRNINIRLDLGFVLDGVDTKARTGDSRLHFVTTLLF
jgi:hemolysin activation/secretion protein